VDKVRTIGSRLVWPDERSSRFCSMRPAVPLHPLSGRDPGHVTVICCLRYALACNFVADGAQTCRVCWQSQAVMRPVVGNRRVRRAVHDRPALPVSTAALHSRAASCTSTLHASKRPCTEDPQPEADERSRGDLRRDTTVVCHVSVWKRRGGQGGGIARMCR
jgi:hypothetical protein